MYCATEGVEWMQVFVLGRRVHPYIDRAQFSRCSITLASTEAIDEISALVDTPTWYACCCLDAEKNGPEGVLE